MQIHGIYKFYFPNDDDSILVTDAQGAPLEDIYIQLKESNADVVIHVPETTGYEPEAEAVIPVEGKKLRFAEQLNIEVSIQVPSAEHKIVSSDFIGYGEKHTDPLACSVVEQFLKALRWRTGQYWLPNILTSNFIMRAVYKWEDKHSEEILRSMRLKEHKRGRPEMALSAKTWNQIGNELRKAEVHSPLSEVLYLDALRYCEEHDYRVALVLAAVVLEVELTKLIEKRLREKCDATDSQINRFVQEMSNRLLSTVMLGLFCVGDKSFREHCRQIFEYRNNVLHRRQKVVTPEQADLAISTAKQMMDFASMGSSTSVRTLGT